MRRMLERITADITGFVAQRDDVAMAVRVSAAAAPAFQQVLAPFAEASAAGMFHTHDAAFRDPEQFVGEVIRAFAVIHEAYREVMADSGLTPWPALPPVVADAGLPPVLRLRELMVFSRSVFARFFMAAPRSCSLKVLATSATKIV